VLEQAGPLLDSLSDDAIAPRCEAIYHVAYCENWYQQFELALPHFHRGLAVSRATGQGHFVLPLSIGVALTLERLGRLPEALETIESAIEACRIANNNLWLSWALSLNSWILAQQGDLVRALPAGEEALAVARAHDCQLVVAAVGWAFGGALLEAGEFERSRAVVLETGGGPELPHFAATYRCWDYELLTRAEIGLGRLDSARDWARRLTAQAERLELAALIGSAHRARASVAIADDDPGLAVDHARLAVESFEQTNMQVERERARLVLGRAYGFSGEAASAVAVLQQSEQALAGLGAEPLRREAAAALRVVGGRAAERTVRAVGGGDGLTPRQLEIAQLVARGRSNREIAAALFLSEKTVENHLARAFAKLGVNSRAALAAAVARDQAQMSGSPPATS
jgi:DNA-binding NarL/FixJ family response regulator